MLITILTIAGAFAVGYLILKHTAQIVFFIGLITIGYFTARFLANILRSV